MLSPFRQVYYIIFLIVCQAFFETFLIFFQIFFCSGWGVFPLNYKSIIPHLKGFVKWFLKKIENFGKIFFSKSSQKCLTKILKCGIMVDSGSARPRAVRKLKD